MVTDRTKSYYLSDQKYQKYKSHLVAYAHARYKTNQPAQTVTITQPQGTIFSQKNVETFSYYSILISIHAGIQSVAGYIVRISPFYQPHPISYRSFIKKKRGRPPLYKKSLKDRVFKIISGAKNWIFSLVSLPGRVLKTAFRGFKRTRTQVKETGASLRNSAGKKYTSHTRWIRLLYRWNRKKRLQFTKEVKTTSSSFGHSRLIQVILAPFKPFYYSFRLYPLHSCIAILLSGAIFAGTFGLHEIIFKDLPSVMELSTREPVVSSKILDRNGKVLYRVYKDENRTIVPLSQISPYLVSATIAIEDKDFYKHHGFSVRGIVRAARSTFTGKRLEGGSTITQQLVKLRLLTPERTWERKVKEVILSVLVEGTYSKEEILFMYLNQVPYGGSTYGIEEAAQRYFGKPAKNLSLSESALLAGLPAAPTVYSPFGPNPDLADQRQDEVLRRMVEDHYITQTEANSAGNETLAFRKDQIDILAPHFVMYVRELLAKQYGEESLLTDGLEIRTSLDLDLQNKTQEVVTKEVAELGRMRISNGAALVTNPGTGEVLAMVGSTNYFDFEHDGQVNVTLRPRQPGSSIKPLVYAMALEKGSTVTSLIQDEPTTYNIGGSQPYSPKNYDGKFHGAVPLKEALASSYNIPAVKTLDSVGVPAMINKAEAMGITTWQDRKRFGLSLSLGSGEVRMADLATLYSAFANQGESMAINPILEVRNYKGEVLYRNTCAIENQDCSGKKVLDPRVAFLISNILSDNKARTPAFGPMSELFIPGQEVAVKTGTTNGLHDNWAVGYTSDRLTAVWVGNNDNSPMSYVASGVTGASPIWNKIMRLMLDDKNPHTFPVPSGMTKVATCFRTGTLPCGGCSRVSEEYYVTGTEPKSTCNIARKMPENTPSSVASEVRNEAHTENTTTNNQETRRQTRSQSRTQTNRKPQQPRGQD